jgi:hypothetical protein
VCFCCGSPDRLNVHHRRYSTLCDEPVGDFVIVCRDCHKDIEWRIKSGTPRDVAHMLTKDAMMLHRHNAAMAAGYAELIDVLIVVQRHFRRAA